MKKPCLLFFIFVFFFTPSLTAQETPLKGKAAGVQLQGEKLEAPAPELDTTFIILGTMTDYMGRKVGLKSTDFVDRYFDYEAALYEFIQESTSEVIELSQKGRNIKLLSDELAKKLNSYYTFKKEGASSKDGRNWAGTLQGTFNKARLQTRAQKQSFLMGTLLRYGEDLGSDIYKIQLANSSAKCTIIVDLLQDLGCTQIYYYRNPDLIPVSTSIYFKPTDAFKKQLMPFAGIMATIKKAKIKYYQEMVNQEFSWPEDTRMAALKELWTK